LTVAVVLVLVLVNAAFIVPLKLLGLDFLESYPSLAKVG